ncbi:uncharacterized protein EI90DRAFT_101526 [Cantharellus anzutake]|uniref:uncharacterized protein n=1 Tax=Cantharellus anzutake TaxID=1750568 RepID=UPI001906F08A|nr:uncharacterized protein EI90DRAFT_101526 [Cantharellus anzutake]KAF8337020.1 hypothetical protein EI90DRAFT_101526 [Cantharellus anzutake]
MPRKRKAPQPVATPHHSGEELLQPSTSSPRVPEIRVVRARTAQPDDESGHDEPGGSYLEPPGARSRSKVSRWYMRKLSRKSSGPDRPGTLDPQDSVLPSLEDSELSESQCSSPQNIDSSPSAPSTHLVLDANTSLRTRLEHAGMGTALPPPSNSTSSSSAGPAGDGKKPTVSAIKFILQIATSALKISPVPYLNEIPGLLLTLLQACETVDSNNENLKGLNDEVRSAYTTILRPLQLCTGQIPSEVVFLLKEFHSTLEEQIKHIDSLRAQGLMKRIILASNIAQSISNVNACINKAIASFSVCLLVFKLDAS